MKKVLASIVLALIFAANVSAQSEWTFNTRAWSTNYFTTLIFDAVTVTTKEVILDGEDSDLADRIIPTADLVFPFGVKKEGFGGMTEIYCPYHRAFGNPFKNPGDYGIGIDASWKPSFIGVYAGAFYKSQEVVFKQFNSIRGYYFQPRLGLIAGKGDEHAVELGAFYDVLTGCGGRMAGANKDMLRGGFGFDVAYSFSPDDNRQFLLQISTPLHNFFSKDYEKATGFDRRVGYIMLTSRIKL
ncbi:MAG: hypothetical protein J5770_00150 [Bacteroidaceae bacterium]|nr:hypothetical protein [Bacteroidaceae bacterium]